MTTSRQINLHLILLAATLLFAGCGGTPVSGVPASIYGHSSGEIRTPITVLLTLSKAPRLDEPVRVTLIVTSTQNAPGTTAEILLPQGAAAIDGALTWTGDLSTQQPQQIQATIKFTQEGDWTLAGKALRPAGGGNVWGDMAVIYLHVTREAGQVGFPEESNAPHDGAQAPTRSSLTDTP